jgi:hypothetical protein
MEDDNSVLRVYEATAYKYGNGGSDSASGDRDGWLASAQWSDWGSLDPGRSAHPPTGTAVRCVVRIIGVSEDGKMIADQVFLGHVDT